MTLNLPRNARKLNDHGVSPVIGTIMMVAVTVVLAATVVAVMNGFGDNSISKPANIAFKTQAVDTNSNAASDHLKISYVTGPANLTASEVLITVKDSAGTSYNPVSAKTSAWNAGDFVVYDLNAGSYFVTVSARGNTIVDQIIAIDE